VDQPHNNFPTQIAEPSTLSAFVTYPPAADCNPPFLAYKISPENNPCVQEDPDLFLGTGGSSLSEVAEYLWTVEPFEGGIAATTCSTISVSAEGPIPSVVTYK
jgi:hypothetical protein